MPGQFFFVCHLVYTAAAVHNCSKVHSVRIYIHVYFMKQKLFWICYPIQDLVQHQFLAIKLWIRWYYYELENMKCDIWIFWSFTFTVKWNWSKLSHCVELTHRVCHNNLELNLWGILLCGVIFAAYFAVDTSLPIEFKRMAWDSIFWSIKSCRKKNCTNNVNCQVQAEMSPLLTLSKMLRFFVDFSCMYSSFFCIAYLKWKKEQE